MIGGLVHAPFLKKKSKKHVLRAPCAYFAFHMQKDVQKVKYQLSAEE
jgi:hypothetical protein